MELFSFFNNTRIKGFIFTDISRDGLLLGININKVSEYLSFSKKPIIVGGGLASYEDIKILSDLKNRKLEGVIAGKSFYLGLIDILKGQEIMDDYA